MSMLMAAALRGSSRRIPATSNRVFHGIDMVRHVPTTQNISVHRSRRPGQRQLHTTRQNSQIRKTLQREDTFGPPITVAFLGLGAMGYQMAKRLAIIPVEEEVNTERQNVRGVVLHRGKEMHRGMESSVLRNVLIWNRSEEEAIRC